MFNRVKAAFRREASRSGRADAGAGRSAVFEGEGVLVARDPGLFGPGRESFCRRLAGALSRQRDVQRVEISLGSGTCRVEFAAGIVDRAEMARRFAESVRAAIAPAPAPSDGVPGGDRGWTKLTMFPAEDAGPAWETTREGRGDLRLRNRALGEERGRARRVARDLASAPGVESSRAGLLSRDLRIRFDPGATSAGALISAARDALHQDLRPDPAAPDGDENEVPTVVTGLRRVWYLTLAAGSFTMTLVGLIVPGIPTVPFLLATSYYLVRSSPALNRLLRRSRFFGPILEDLQVHGGLRPINKAKLLGLTSALGATVVLVVGIPAGLLLVVVASLAFSFYAVLRIPGIPSDREPASTPGRPAPAVG